MGPYIIKEKYSNVTYILVIVEGMIDTFSINGKHLKSLYA